MSVLTIQVGQCGNQIGLDFFSLLMKDAVPSSRNCKQIGTNNENLYGKDVIKRFFTKKDVSGTTKYTAKAILVDTEPKVVNRVTELVKRQGDFHYSKENISLQRRGSGNNWAYGFNSHGEKTTEDIVGSCRKELERCDRFGGFLVLMSSAGGTGSGLGTRVTTSIRDEFPKKFVVNQVVLPYASGEVILQNYNTVLTLGHLYGCSHAIGIFENDNLNLICQKSLGLKSVGMDHMNAVAAHKLASVLQPSLHHGKSLHSTAAWQSSIGDFITTLCSMPRYKLFCIRNTPFVSNTTMAYSTFLWPGLMKHLHQMLITNAALDQGINWELQPPPLSHKPDLKFTRSAFCPSGFNKSVANLLVLRGKDLHQADISQFLSKQLYRHWELGTPCNVWSQPRSFMGYEKSAAVVTNSQAPIPALDNVVRKGWNMFSSRAYVHQYLQCGLEEDDLVEAFASVEQILSDYSSI